MYIKTFKMPLWQHVLFLCVTRTPHRMSLVMVMRRMLCSVRHAAQHTTHNHNQAHSKPAYD